MVLERKLWLRRLLVLQLAVAWPCSWALWAGGSSGSLALAAVVLWLSTAACVVGILAYRRADSGDLVRRH